MNPILFTQILVRVLAVYLMAQAIIVVSQIASFPFGSYGDLDDSSLVYWVFSLTFLMPFIVSILLWVFTSPLSTAIVGRKVSTISDSPLSTNSVMGAVISVAGLLIIVIYLPSLISTWVQYDTAVSTFDADKIKPYLIAHGVRIFFGVLLFVGARYWMALVNRFREFGLEK